MNPRCRKQSAYMHLLLRFLRYARRCIRKRTMGTVGVYLAPRRAPVYNRINHKSNAFPRKRIFVIYIAR